MSEDDRSLAGWSKIIELSAAQSRGETYKRTSMEVNVTHDVYPSGKDEGYTLSIRQASHAWARGELTRTELVQIRDTISQFLLAEDDS